MGMGCSRLLRRVEGEKPFCYIFVRMAKEEQIVTEETVTQVLPGWSYRHTISRKRELFSASNRPLMGSVTCSPFSGVPRAAGFLLGKGITAVC